MPMALFIFSLLLGAVQLFQNVGGSANLDIQARTLEGMRTQLRQLWNEFVMSNRGKSMCISSSSGKVVNLTKGLGALNVTEGELVSVVFYQVYSSDQDGCTDRQPTEERGVNTCELQRNAGYCDARWAGLIKDGFCARTCGLCGQNISGVGMRATFAFPKMLRITNDKRLVTVQVEPNGRFFFYDMCHTPGHTKSKTSMHCGAKVSPAARKSQHLLLYVIAYNINTSNYYYHYCYVIVNGMREGEREGGRFL